MNRQKLETRKWKIGSTGAPKVRIVLVLISIFYFLFSISAQSAYAVVTTSSEDTLLRGILPSSSVGANPIMAQTSIDTARRAIDQIDRAFDNPTDLIGANPTARQLTQFNTAVRQYRAALPGMYGGFSNLDQLFGADAGEKGIVTQGLEAARSVNQIMQRFSNGQQSLGGSGFQEALTKLSAAENTINLVKNFGNTGLGTMREGQLALSSIGQLFPGLGQKLAPVAQVLGTVANLENTLKGMTQSFGNLGGNLGGTISSLSRVSGRLSSVTSRTGDLTNPGRMTTAAQDTTLLDFNSRRGDLTAQDMKDIEAVKADVHATEVTSGAAASAAEKTTADAAGATNEGTKETSESGVEGTNGDKTKCQEGYTSGKSSGNGVPTREIPGELLKLTGKTNRLTKQICDATKKIEEIQKNYFDKELKTGEGSRDAVATKVGIQALEATRQSVKQEEQQMFLKNDKTQGPAFVRNQGQYINEIRTQKTKNLIADVNKNITGPRAELYKKAIEASEQNRYDEEAQLLGSLQLKGPGDDPDAELAKLDPVDRAFLYTTNPQRYLPRAGVETLLSNKKEREDKAIEEAVQELYWGNGVRPKREVAETDSEGNPRNFLSTSPGFLEKQLLSDALVTSNINETTGVKTDTDLARTKKAPEGPANVRNFTSSGNGNQNGLNSALSALQAFQQLACSFGATSMCGGGGNRDRNEDDNNNYDDPTPPTPDTAPIITFSTIQMGIIEGTPYSAFTWQAEDADSCTASNNWVTYGDTDPSVQGSISPSEATTTPEIMMYSGDDLPLGGQAVVFHPIVMKAVLSAEKAAQNRGNAVADLKNVGAIVFTKDEDNTPVQLAKFEIPSLNVETNDLIHLDFPGNGVSISVPARGTPPTGAGIAGALAGAYLSNATTISHVTQGTIIYNSGASLIVQTSVPYDVTIAESARYAITCEGAGGSITRDITVPFTDVPFATPIPKRAGSSSTPTKPKPIDPSVFWELFDESLE